METFVAYIPMDRRQALARGQELPERTQGATLFADISGFTPLTAALAQELGRRRGAEELGHQLNAVYDVLIAEVHRYRGSVVGFSGDAITCWFGEGEELTGPQKPAGSVLRATACALAMQQVMSQFAEVKTPAGTTVSFAIKVAISSGPMRRFLVGDLQPNVIDVLAGAALDRIAKGKQLAEPGEVVVGPQTYAQLGERAQVTAWREDESGQRFAVISGLAEFVAPAPWPELPPENLTAEQLRPWLSSPVYVRLQSGQGQFLAELRPAVALFLQFGGLDYEHDETVRRKLDAYVRSVQQVVSRYEGLLIQLTTGDKGSYLYAVFGAPVAHEDDVVRAVAAALELRRPPPELDFITTVNIGLSQGRMRTGAYGSRTRCTYGVIGDETNMASQLMGVAQPGQVIVSEQVVEAVGVRFRFKELGAVTIKGRDEPLRVYEALGERRAEPATGSPGRQTVLVGRAQEKAQLAAQLAALRQDGAGGVVIVEGEPGIGKTRLVEDLLEQARSQGITTLYGAADAIERSTPYYAWRPIFQTYFDLSEAEDVAVARQKVMQQLEGKAQLLERAPLLDAVLPLDLPDNELTAQMTGEVRADNTNEFLVRLLSAPHRANGGASKGAGGRLLVLEDAHWLDSASWALTQRVSQGVASVLLVIVARPLSEPRPKEYNTLIQAPETQRLVLNSMAPEETLTLVCRRLEVRALPEPVAALIGEKAQGNPFFSEELAYALRDTAVLRIEKGACYLAPEAGDLRALNFPDTIEGVVTSRIDRLTPPQQLTVKVASVIGRVFAFRTLRDVHPVELDRSQLPDYLDTLERLDITLLETPEPDLVYLFKHVITQEVAYNLLLFAQRRQLHRAVAEWYESFYAANLSPHYPLLAYHWQRAVGDELDDSHAVAKAVEYLGKSGEQALRNFAISEAVTFFEQALALEAAAGIGGQEARRASWNLQLGEAYVYWSRYPEAREPLETGLALLGLPVPTSTLSQVGNLLGQIVRQVLHRKRSRAYLGSLPDRRDALLAASKALAKLTEVYYYAPTDETLLTLYAAFRQLNLAELAGPSPEMADGYVAVGALLGFIPMPKLAKAYLRRAQDAVEQAYDTTSASFVAVVSCFYYGGVAMWEEARMHGEQAIELSGRIGHQRRMDDVLVVFSMMDYMRGDFASSIRQAEEVRESSRRLNIPREIVVGSLEKCWGLLALDRVAEVTVCLDTVQEQMAAHPNVADEGLLKGMLYGTLAVTHLRQSEHSRAFEAAQQALSVTAKTVPSSFFALPGYVYPPEVFLYLWEAQHPEPGLDDLARAACKTMHKYARIFTIGQPQAWRWQGLYEWLSGKPRKAFKAWQKSLAIAEQFGMLYEYGLTHFEIGRHLDESDPARAEHLKRAGEIFEQIGAVYDLARVQELVS